MLNLEVLVLTPLASGGVGGVLLLLLQVMIRPGTWRIGTGTRTTSWQIPSPHQHTTLARQLSVIKQTMQSGQLTPAAMALPQTIQHKQQQGWCL